LLFDAAGFDFAVAPLFALALLFAAVPDFVAGLAVEAPLLAAVVALPFAELDEEDDFFDAFFPPPIFSRASWTASPTALPALLMMSTRSLLDVFRDARGTSGRGAVLQPIATHSMVRRNGANVD
jgi:hypothetical protein